MCDGLDLHVNNTTPEGLTEPSQKQGKASELDLEGGLKFSHREGGRKIQQEEPRPRAWEPRVGQGTLRCWVRWGAQSPAGMRGNKAGKRSGSQTAVALCVTLETLALLFNEQ